MVDYINELSTPVALARLALKRGLEGERFGDVQEYILCGGKWIVAVNLAASRSEDLIGYVRRGDRLMYVNKLLRQYYGPSLMPLESLLRQIYLCL